MFGLLQRFRPTRALDDDGMVACPLRGVSLEYEHCLGCTFLEGSRSSEDGTLVEIRCVPTFGPLLPSN
jgi:hypothetical protein